MKVRDGKLIKMFLTLLYLISQAFKTNWHSTGWIPPSMLLGKLTEVRTVYLAQRASEATAHFKAHSGAYLPETLTSMLASIARLY